MIPMVLMKAWVVVALVILPGNEGEDPTRFTLQVDSRATCEQLARDLRVRGIEAECTLEYRPQT